MAEFVVKKQQRGHDLKLNFSVVRHRDNDRNEMLSQPFNVDSLALIAGKLKPIDTENIQLNIRMKKTENAKNLTVSVDITCDQNDQRFVCPNEWLEVLIKTKRYDCKLTKYHTVYLYTIEVNLSVHTTSMAVPSALNIQLHGDTEFTDFKLQAADGSVAVHKNVLFAHSDMFRTMLTGQWKETAEGSINMEGVTLLTLKHLKDYMYLGTLPEEGLEALLLVARYCLMDNLVADCIEKLTKSVKPETFDGLVEFACHNNIVELKNRYECDVCGVRFPELRRLTRHINEHFRRFLCKLCGTRFHNRGLLYMHFKHGPHGRRMECKKCGASFDCTKSREFFAHYRNMHGLVVCDYCGMRSSTKSRLAHHIKTAMLDRDGGIRCPKKSRLAHYIRIRHTEIVCKICDIRFEKFDSLTQHNRRKHVVEASERNYCVECDLQFGNDLLYNEHVTRSVKHRVKPRIPCPECDRTYSKRCYMMNHYNLEHLKKSKYVCPFCQRSFLNGFRLRNHVKYTHEKAPKPKNHICSHCGRGFHTRRILDNHVRTHTGERPYECEHCPAAFAQSTALNAHLRSAHK